MSSASESDTSDVSDKSEADYGEARISDSDEEGEKYASIDDEFAIEKKINSYRMETKTFNFYNMIMQDINTPRYEDITLMINSNIPFLIDADALLIYSFMQDNHEFDLGGQHLHVIYFCERFLNLLLEKGGNFIIVFFDVWNKFWKNNSYVTCLRYSMYNHLKKNTSYRLHNFVSFDSAIFKRFIDIEKPRCILLDISYHLTLQSFNERISVSQANKLFINTQKALVINCTEIVFFRANDLPCIDISQIDVDQSTVSSYNLSSSIKIDKLNKLLCFKLAKFMPVSPEVSTYTRVMQCNYSNFDARRALVVIASQHFIHNVEDDNDMKLLILCYASQEVLNLENRCCPIIKFKEESLKRLQKIVTLWLECLSQSLISCINNNIDLIWNTVADIWQGTLFSYICYIINNIIYNGDELGHIQEPYELYIKLISQECTKKIKPYPIKPFFENTTGTLYSAFKEQDKIDLYQINNALIQKFCGDNLQGIKWINAQKQQKEFDEVKHWHCRKPLTDDYDRVKDNGIVYGSGFQNRKVLNVKQKGVRYIDMYGRNLEGNIIKAEAIVCENKSNIKKTKKQKAIEKDNTRSEEEKDISKTNKNKKTDNKLSKAQQIIENNKNKKEQEILSKERDAITLLKLNIRDLNLKKKINAIDLTLGKLTMKETRFSAILVKLKTFRDYIKKDKKSIDNDHVKVIFLLIQTILQDYCDMMTDEKNRILISKLLHQFGFREVAQRNNLPLDIEYDMIQNCNWIQYQLKYLGPEMKRLTEGQYDSDIGFTPDPWQVDFIAAIRKKQSALVVAPTSSGKTFAAYYCMKRVLKESEDGIVIYVAPTKALVNQVHATVYARFKNINLADGKAVVGVFTRDFKINALNSRILITVPQCLEILLMSPRRFTWLKHIAYVIFDEVHKLSADKEGLVWERCLLLIKCPFLALSATISDVDDFYNWLQSNENFKKEQDRLNGSMRRSYEVVKVEHTSRHSDLIKYVYDTSTGLQHYHPYCALDSKILTMYSGVPPSVNLSPCEVLELYDAICKVAPSVLSPEADIINFFSKKSENGFIHRNDVREYEQKLADVFYNIYNRNNDTLLEIIKFLSPNSHHISNVLEIPQLLNHMYEKNMLPCIVFSYNRNLIEFADRLMVRTCKTLYESAVVNRRDEKKKDKTEKKEKKMREKEAGSNKDVKETRSIKPSYILKDTGSIYKGTGIADSNDMEFIEGNLRKAATKSCKSLLLNSLPYGIAYHHAGLGTKYKCTVEMLFRMGIVKVVFATGTLALGIHMPCKSVVIFGDSPFLNSIEYHQMSGRAGRRGFDTEGNVIFMGLTKKRHDMLMTDKLPKMLGNFPVNVTFIARLLILVTKVTDKNKSSEEVTNITISSALTLLENSLIYREKPNLKLQIKYFADFAVQLLFIQGIINQEGAPLKLAGIVSHLHYHEPANLVFAYLLQSGALRNLIKSMDNKIDVEWSLVIVLSHLFARLKIHNLQIDQEFRNSKVILDPLPDIILEMIQNYNEEVKFIFNQYFISVATHLADSLGKDDTLPVSKVKFVPLHIPMENDKENTLSAKIKSSCIKRIACSSFIALSGADDSDLYTGTMISNIRHEVCPGINVVPLLNTDAIYNGYAADFYRHGNLTAIIVDNGLKQGHEFSCLNDFLLVLKTIVVSLEELEPTSLYDPVYVSFRSVLNKYQQKYENVFR